MDYNIIHTRSLREPQYGGRALARGVRVNVVAPGFTKDPNLDRSAQAMNRQASDWHTSKPIG